MIYKKYYRFTTFPKLTFARKQSFDNVVAVLTDKDLESPPSFLQKHFIPTSHISSDLKNLKSLMLYGHEAFNDPFKRCLVLYDNIDETKEGYRKKLLGIGTKATKTLLSNKIYDFDLFFSDKLTPENLGVILNGLVLTNYKFERKSTPSTPIDSDNKTEATSSANNNNQNDKESKKFIPLSAINIVSPDEQKLSDYTNFLIQTSKYSLMARELVNERPNISTTTYMVEKAKEIAKAHPKITVTTIIGEELQQKGLNLLYSVGKGSTSPPALVCLKYEGDPSNKDNVIALVGKGIVFDAGGLNIKPTGSMEDMFIDKAGACTVLSTLKGVAEMNLPVNIVATVAFAENFLGANCYRPSDIIQSLKGLTVEIGNTDAEGRLVLADAMTWTQHEHKPKILIELSTLTGACMIALGEEMGGLFSNDDNLAKSLLNIGELVNEPVWRLPITEEHRETMKSAHADLNNAGKSRYGGASKGAAFLESFVEKDVKWAHFDIAGPAESRSEKGLYSAGGTGFGVKLLLHYLREKVDGQGK